MGVHLRQAYSEGPVHLRQAYSEGPVHLRQAYSEGPENCASIQVRLFIRVWLFLYFEVYTSSL